MTTPDDRVAQARIEDLASGGMALKRLSAHEVNAAVSNGHEIQRVAAITRLVGSKESVFACLFAVPADGTWKTDPSSIRWYKRKPPRKEWRGYVRTSLLWDYAKPGDLLAILRTAESSLLAVVAPQGDPLERSLLALAGTKSISRHGLFLSPEMGTDRSTLANLSLADLARESETADLHADGLRDEPRSDGPRFGLRGIPVFAIWGGNRYSKAAQEQLRQGTWPVPESRSVRERGSPGAARGILPGDVLVIGFSTPERLREDASGRRRGIRVCVGVARERTPLQRATTQDALFRTAWSDAAARLPSELEAALRQSAHLAGKPIRVEPTAHSRVGGPVTALPHGAPTDRIGAASRRTEQGALARAARAGRVIAPCSLCGEDFRVEYLITAHIKARKDCSDKERRDPRVVMLCCPPCDALFELGYVQVNGRGRILRTLPAPPGAGLTAHADAIAGRKCSAFSAATRAYFRHRRGGS